MIAAINPVAVLVVAAAAATVVAMLMGLVMGIGALLADLKRPRP